MTRLPDPRERGGRQPARPPLEALPTGPYLISTRPPSHNQLWIAALLSVAMLAAFGVTFAFRHVQLARLDAFVPVANTIVIIDDTFTAVLLFTQFSVTRDQALLVLANGFLLRAFIFVPHALTFPGAFAPAGLLGANPQTTAWLYQAQYIVFLLTAIRYTMLRDRPIHAPAGNSRTVVPIIVSIAGATAAVLLLTFVLTTRSFALPHLMADPLRISGGFHLVGQPLMLLIALGSIVVFRRRATSMIDLWLQVAMWSWVLEGLFTAIAYQRFSLVFYVNRTMGMVSSSFVLIAFFSQSVVLQRRLELAMAAREQVREGHRTAIDIIVSSLAHELRQPLTSILVNESAGSKLLAAGPAAHEEVAEVLADIRGSVLRANEIIGSIREIFAASLSDLRAIDVRDLAKEAVELMRIELEMQRVVVDFQLPAEMPPIQGHHGQLLEVLLNGLKNGLDSLGNVSGRPRQLCVRTGALEAGRLAIDIEDSGGGIDPRMRNRLFEPFHSTKPGGMGLGLSICQSIVLAHGGTLSLKPRAPHGAVFRVELPVLPVVSPAEAHLPGARASDARVDA